MATTLGEGSVDAARHCRLASVGQLRNNKGGYSRYSVISNKVPTYMAEYTLCPGYIVAIEPLY